MCGFVTSVPLEKLSWVQYGLGAASYTDQATWNPFAWRPAPGCDPLRVGPGSRRWSPSRGARLPALIPFAWGPAPDGDDPDCGCVRACGKHRRGLHSAVVSRRDIVPWVPGFSSPSLLILNFSLTFYFPVFYCQQISCFLREPKGKKTRVLPILLKS